jgi:hypothetical protein
MMNKTQDLYNEAQKISNEIPNFFNAMGAGKGNLITNDFMGRLRTKMFKLLSYDYSEKRICTENALTVDYYFPDERTIVEVALGLKKPNSEYEKDILKTLIARENNIEVDKLVFIAKPDAIKKCNQPARKRIRKWLEDNHQIIIEVLEIHPNED